MRNIISIIFILICCSSCEKPIKERLCGAWVVDGFFMDGREVLFEQVDIGNMISFYEDGKFIGFSRIGIDSVAEGKWEVIEKSGDNFVRIYGCYDTLYNGLYHLQLSKLNRSVANDRLELTSMKLKITATQ